MVNPKMLDVKNSLNISVSRPRGGTWVNVCWVCAAGPLEPLPHYSLLFGQL